MSLINDALKKAQKQRTGAAPALASMPSVGGETPHRIAKRAKPAGFDTLIVRAGAGAGIALLLAVGGYFAFRGAPEDRGQKTEVSNQAPSQSASPNAGSPLQPSPDLRLTSADGPSASSNPQVSVPQPAAAPVFTLPVAPKPEPVASVPASEPQASRPTPQASVPSPAPASPTRLTGSDPRVSPFRSQDSTPAQATGPQTALKLEPRAIQFIENIKVAGIMARPTDSKVLMNDRVYRLGSIVEAEMGLTLVGITSDSLTFEDGNGGRYTRIF